MADGITVLQLMQSRKLLGPGFEGESWEPWKAVLSGAFALPMTAEREATFRQLAGGRAPPQQRVKQLWIIAGRGAGKDSIAGLIATHSVISDRRPFMRPGEVASCLCAAADRSQARIVKSYIHSNFADTAVLAPLITRETQYGFEVGELRAECMISTADFRTIRGRTVSCFIADEIAFWNQSAEIAANSDSEIINAALPGLGRLPDSMLVAITTAYGRTGIAYEYYRKYHGKDDPEILTIHATTRQLNPKFSQATIDRALERDPVKAKAEYLSEFRADIDSYISAEILDSCIAVGCFERLPEQRVFYSGFVDMSGGVGDSSALCIAHNSEDKRTVVDVIREIKAPHSPMEAVREFCEVLRAYRISNITGDRYGAEWVSEQFRLNGVSYTVSERHKSQIYTEMIPLLASRKLELLDNERMRGQFLGLERRTGPSGRDTIDHGQGGKDDVCNAVAGACVLVGGKPDQMAIYAGLVRPAGLFAAVPERVN